MANLIKSKSAAKKLSNAYKGAKIAEGINSIAHSKPVSNAARKIWWHKLKNNIKFAAIGLSDKTRSNYAKAGWKFTSRWWLATPYASITSSSKTKNTPISELYMRKAKRK